MASLRVQDLDKVSVSAFFFKSEKFLMPYILGLFQETCMQDLRKCIISYEPQNRLELGRGCQRKIAESKISHSIFFG